MYIEHGKIKDLLPKKDKLLTPKTDTFIGNRF